MCRSNFWCVGALAATALSWANLTVHTLQAQVPRPAGSGMGMLNLALMATGISTLGAAAIGVYKGVRAAQIEVAEAWMKSKPGQFEAQMKALQQRTEDANEKLHRMNNDQNARDLTHAAEVQSLRVQLQLALEQLQIAQEEVKASREENRRLMVSLSHRMQAGQAEIIERVDAVGEAAATVASEAAGQVKEAVIQATAEVVQAAAEAKP